MTMRKHSVWKRAALALTLFAAFSMDGGARGQQRNPLIRLPDGNWSFGIYPYHGPGGENFPVVVGQVTSELDAGAGVTKVGIENNSDRTVAAVRFKWLLFEGERRDKVLQQGRTPLLALRTPLAPEGKRILLYQVVSLLKVYRPLLKNGLLNGDFEAEILVEEVHFSDNSVWREGGGQAGRRSKRKNSELKITRASFAQCPKQKCKSDLAGTANTAYYSCEASQYNELCSVASSGRACTQTACGFGGGIEPETPIEYNPGNP